MPAPIRNGHQWSRYLAHIDRVILQRVPNVRDAFFTLVGLVSRFKDADSSVEVRNSREGIGRALWVRLGGRRYVFSYSHQNHQIELRDGTLQGAVVMGFDNQTPVSQMIKLFEALSQGA